MTQPNQLARSYKDLLEDPFLNDDDALRLKGDATLGHVAALLIQRGEKETAGLLLDVDTMAVEWDGDAHEYDLWLEVSPEDRDRFTTEVMTQLQELCKEVNGRTDFGIGWICVRELMPKVGPDWRQQLRDQLGGKRPTNHARRVRASVPQYVADYMSFTNQGELTVYQALKKIQENDLPSDDTIGIYPLPGGRIPGRTWEPDVLVTYRGRAGILEVDGPHHNARRAFDVTRDHLLRDAGVGFVDRIPVEALESPAELVASLMRFLRRLQDVK